MVLRIEKQRSVQSSFSDNLNNSALLVKTIQIGGGRGQSNKKKYGNKKEDMTCDHCDGNSHIRDTCFKLHDYPEWFKQLRKENNSSSRTQANMVSNPLDENIFAARRESSTKLSPVLYDLVQQEVNKILKGKQTTTKEVNFAHISEFAGKTDLDTGATSHICAFRDNFKFLKYLNKKVIIHLPNGSAKTVNEYGDLHLSDSFILKNVLFVSSFNYNLLSVRKVVQDKTMSCNFYFDYCVFQDLKISNINVVGRVKGNLYFLDCKLFCQKAMYELGNVSDTVSCSVQNKTDYVSMWHSHLGHHFMVVVKHIPFLKNKECSSSICEVFSSG